MGQGVCGINFFPTRGSWFHTHTLSYAVVRESHHGLVLLPRKSQQYWFQHRGVRRERLPLLIHAVKVCVWERVLPPHIIKREAWPALCSGQSARNVVIIYMCYLGVLWPRVSAINWPADHHDNMGWCRFASSQQLRPEYCCGGTNVTHVSIIFKTLSLYSHLPFALPILYKFLVIKNFTVLLL